MVVIIGILTALATPAIIGVLRDRRANSDTMTIAEVYRFARNRSMGRGAATLVRYSANGWEVFESIVDAGPPAVNLPTSSCLNTDWTAGGNNRRVSTWSGPVEDDMEVLYYDPSGANQTDVEVCFTPRGRTYIAGVGDPLEPMDGVAYFTTQRLPTTENQRLRTVYIAPNGVARIQL